MIMHKRTWLCLGICCLLAALACPPAWAGQPLDLTLLHFNDSHSRFEPVPASLNLAGAPTYLGLGGMPQMVSAVKKQRAAHPNTLLLHAGDSVQGTLYFTKYGGQPEMDFLNLLGVQAMCLGNHEFDRGPEFLTKLLTRAQFPVLACNMDASALPELARLVRPWVVLTVGGAKIGVIGAITQYTHELSSPGKKLVFAPVAPAVTKAAAQLTAQGVDKIVVLTHQGYEEDLAMAAKVPGIDLVVGGHSHTLLDAAADLAPEKLVPEGPYPTQVKGIDGNPVYVVQAWKWTQSLGVLSVSFDQEGRITKAQGGARLLISEPFKRKDPQGNKQVVDAATRQAIVKQIEANPLLELVSADGTATAKLAPYSAGLEQMRREQVAIVASDLAHIRVPGTTPQGVKLPQGSQIAPLVAQSMLWKAQGGGTPGGLGVSLSVVNGGGIRTGLPAGPLTVGDVYSLLPFANTLVVLQLSGAEIKAAVQKGIDRDQGAFPYLAGARYKVDMNRPAGQSLVSLEIKGTDGKWRPVEEKATHLLVTNSYLAKGGNGYDIFAQASGPRQDTGFVDAEVFMEYCRWLKVIRPPVSTGVTYIPAGGR